MLFADKSYNIAIRLVMLFGTKCGTIKEKHARKRV